MQHQETLKFSTSFIVKTGSFAHNPSCSDECAVREKYHVLPRCGNAECFSVSAESVSGARLQLHPAAVSEHDAVLSLSRNGIVFLTEYDVPVLSMLERTTSSIFFAVPLGLSSLWM